MSGSRHTRDERLSTSGGSSAAFLSDLSVARRRRRSSGQEPRLDDWRFPPERQYPSVIMPTDTQLHPEGREQQLERLSQDLKDQVQMAKDRISDRYAKLIEERSFESEAERRG